MPLKFILLTDQRLSLLRYPSFLLSFPVFPRPHGYIEFRRPGVIRNANVLRLVQISVTDGHGKKPS